jgi:hypothetical protein
MSEEAVCFWIGVGCAAVMRNPAGLAVGGVIWILAKVFL